MRTSIPDQQKIIRDYEWKIDQPGLLLYDQTFSKEAEMLKLNLNVAQIVNCEYQLLDSNYETTIETCKS